MIKQLIFTLAFSLLFTVINKAQTEIEPTGFDGDHFSLEGALDLFKQSSSIEDFEKKLNEQKNNINNLDLNEDGAIDYLRVEDKMDGEVHAIIIQAPISDSENQDIAVIEIEKTGMETAILQIVGDEEIYGQQKIVEPFEEQVEQSGKGGPNENFHFRKRIINVYFWSPVRFIYAPRYRPYVSPYRWRTYPRLWKPWRPQSFHVYHSHHVRYQRHYHVVNTHRVVRAHKVYTPHRRTSTVVRKRTTTVRTTKNGNKVVRQKTTTVKNRNGNRVVGKKSNTAVKKKGNKKVVKKKTTKVRKRRKN
ncbi:MAG: hypothetical protein AB8F94_24470 [Saprospiraceae bacterium]